MAVEWLDIMGRCCSCRNIYNNMKKIQFSRHCFYFPAFRKKYGDRVAELIGKTYHHAGRKWRLQSDFARCHFAWNKSVAERTDYVPYHLYAPFTYFKARRWKNVCYVATVRSDLFYWDVGTSDQFTKCPVEHGGPVIVSMIRTSFRAPIRHTRTL